MSAFKPYHEGFPEFVDLLDPYDDGYLVRLNVLAGVASNLKVPKGHRDGMRSVFSKHATDLVEADHWPEADTRTTVAACGEVGKAMDKQDAEDAAEQRKARWEK